MGGFFAKKVNDVLFPQKNFYLDMVLNTEAVAQRCYVKKVVLQTSENSQENNL